MSVVTPETSDTFVLRVVACFTRAPGRTLLLGCENCQSVTVGFFLYVRYVTRFYRYSSVRGFRRLSSSVKNQADLGLGDVVYPENIRYMADVQAPLAGSYEIYPLQKF